MSASADNLVIHISIAGPSYKISVGGKIYNFEMHSYCGPMPLDKDGEPAKKYHPAKFWEAVSLWARQGQRMEDGLCRWDHEPVDILEAYKPNAAERKQLRDVGHKGGKHFKIIGSHPSVKGE